jgi:uncharacterized protein involved in exopolysaccharide biosynthesis
MNENTNSNQKPEIARSSIADILLVIAKHLKMIILMTIIMVFVVFYFVQKNYIPEYISSAKIFVPASNFSGSQLARLANQFGISTGGGSQLDISSSALFPEIVASRTFAERLLQKKFITEKYGEELSLLAILTYGTGTPRVGLDTLILRASKRIPIMVSFEEDPPFLTLTTKTTEAQFSKDLADEVLIELDNLQRHFKSQSTVEKREYIEMQIAVTETELENLEETLKKFRERNRQIEGSPSLLLEHERLMRNVDIQKGIFLTLKQQLELTKIEEVQKSSLVQVLDYPDLPLKVSNPKKNTTYILAAIGGLFLGLCFAFIGDYFTSRNKDEAVKLQDAKTHAWREIVQFITFRWLKIKR